ncbi:immune inhibitor A [Nocardioides luteus]|uniref:Protease n=1 Tax=Nocardioides luteus TaxID=1844 RepID=A0ABQ5T4T3_9ACTN|nr:immune inhibitor A domain-containing protein [Nocardioides luteus]MDR7313654.1 immune inhibitor A [Nocardioides luteus]GGR64229.1 protease [Nocardioides luteus]GLJ70499.1 protease [Nocardioides luteus]
MNRRLTSVLAAVAVAGVTPVALTHSSANAAEETGTPAAAAVKQKVDDKPDALNTKRRELKTNAANAVATGEKQTVTKNGSKVVKMGKGKNARWVEHEPTEKSQLLSFLVEFGEGGNPAFPDNTSGPLHNEIAPPAEDDNSTYWEEDFSRDHYMDMFFDQTKGKESFHNAYKEMSSGRFDLQGDVSDWITLPHAESYYQSADGDETATSMKNYIQDTANAWYESQKASGKTDAEITEYLKDFDIWDRYDLDGDGNFNEPDGYIDHFQAIHSGEGEEAGADPWTIWSHRWAANASGSDGPADFPKAGGVKIGNTDIWIRDYTTEPENGGLGVFAHEFGHDLGLPDFYDTAGGENGTGFWTLMSSGSWLGHGDGTIGTTPNHMGAPEKLFLGWLNHDTVEAGTSKKLTLGPSYHDTGDKTPQALVVNLPDGETTHDVGEGSSGTTFLYSGKGDDRTATAVSPAITVPDGGTLSAKVKYDLEAEYDFTFLEASTDGGATWSSPLATNLSSAEYNNGIHGTSDSSCDVNCADHDPQEYVDLTADLSEYAGQDVQLRFRTANDGGLHYYGFAVDDLSVGSAYSTDFSSFDDWTVKEYMGITDGTYTQTYPRFYIAENRQYMGYDKTLATGPYSFDYAVSAPDKVDHYAYQDGLLVWYQNGAYTDNNTSQHPGGGQALPIDSTAKANLWSDGSIARGRMQGYDATFDVDRADALHLEAEVAGGENNVLDVPKHQSVSTFHDSSETAYWDPSNPAHSTKTAGSGVKIKVLSSNEKKGTMQIKVS